MVDLKKNEFFNSFFADKRVLPSQLTLLAKNLLANCHFSKKYIVQIIRNSDSNKVLMARYDQIGM